MATATVNTAEKRCVPNSEGTQFKAGNTGRPKGARAKLGEEFLKAMLADFEQNGAVVISTVRAEKPDQYLKVVASILPKEIEAGEETINILAELLARIDGRTRAIVPAQPFVPQPQHAAH